MNSPLEKRLENLKRLKVEEEMSSEKSQYYIDDLTLSIAFCEKQLQRKQDYEMVNG